MNIVARLKSLLVPAAGQYAEVLDYLNTEYLQRNTGLWAEQYKNNKPFPHIVIDDFIQGAKLEEILDNFPPQNQPMKRKSNSVNLADGRPAQLLKKSYSDMEVSFPVRQLLWQLNSGAFIGWLEQITGIDGLLPDPVLNGAGVHVTDRGGLLRIHADFNRHPKYHLERRINLLLYLNKDWEESYGGALELWNKTMTSCEQRILPIAGRCVIFSTTSHSYHGHPDPVACPDQMSRRSIALYYYTNGRPVEEQNEAHSTLWQELPGERK